jgi:hypothetical protein
MHIIGWKGLCARGEGQKIFNYAAARQGEKAAEEQ